MGCLHPNTSQPGASLSQFAMSGVMSGGAGSDGAVSAPAASAAGLREAVLAGPARGVSLDGGVGSSVLGCLADGAVVESAVARAGHVDRRRRVLTGEVTVQVILGLCLFVGEGYDSVLARVLPRLPGVLAPGGPVPTGSALSQARTRLVGHGEPMRELFEATAAVAEPATAGSTAFGLVLTAFDGTVGDLAATGEVEAQFAVPSGGRHPQARLVTLVTCGTRRVRAAAVGSYTTSEQELVDSLASALTVGTLNLADRNFFSMHRWVVFAATGAELAWRVKNGAKSLPAKTVEVLPDGSTRVRLHEFDLLVTDERGRTRVSRFRILTTLLDYRAYPARQIAAVYAERWQVELVYYRIKVTLRGAGVVLRGQTPELARQEIWGLLVAYNALCDLAVRAAVSLGVDPDEISFVAVLRLTRTHLSTGTYCRHCTKPSNDGDPTEALVSAIAAHPRNRTGRQRTSPRTARQRRTERTRDVTYTINIVPSNLPKAA